MEKINFKNKPVIEGEEVVLRPFEEKDCEIMVEILSEPNINKLTGSVSCDDEANVVLGLEEKEKTRLWYMSRNDQLDRLDLAVVNKNNDMVIGEVVFNEYEEETNNVNFRVLLSEQSCDKGFGTEAITMFIKYGMEELKFHKICLEVYSFNPRAERVYQKVGFKLEGIKREELIYNNEYYDIKIYGMLKEDYDRQKDGAYGEL